MKHENVTVLFPTRGRAEQARRNLETLQAQGVPVLASICEGDSDTLTMVEELGVPYVTRPDDSTSVEGWNHAYGYARAAGAEWVVLGADDVEWRDGWLDTALDTAKKAGADVVGLMDGHDKARRYGPHYMARVSFLEQHMGGVMCVPHYKAWGFDYELSERADRLNLYAPTPRPVIEHHHPVWGLADMDDTYEAGWPHHEADRALRTRRRQAGYPTDYAPVTAVEGKMKAAPQNKMMPPAENKVNATDAALELLKEHGIDPANVTGTGAGGRITKADAQALVDLMESLKE